VTACYRFPRTHRLLRPAEFQTVFDSTAFKVGEPQFLLLVRPNGLSHPRLGLVIAKKKVRLAVERNRLKRTIRNSFRLHQAALPAVDVIFMARNDLGNTLSADLAVQLDKSWKRLTRKAETPKSTPTASAHVAEPKA
jgi:ribonuclease P protein component